MAAEVVPTMATTSADLASVAVEGNVVMGGAVGVAAGTAAPITMLAIAVPLASMRISKHAEVARCGNVNARFGDAASAMRRPGVVVTMSMTAPR